MIIFAFILTPSVDPLEEKIDDIATDLELNFRDKHLSDALISSKENKIIVLYGE